MPELPELHALAGFLRARLVGDESHSVRAVHLASLSALKTVEPALTDVVGRVVTSVSRRGKWLVVGLAGEAGEPVLLAVHLAKAGWLRWRETMPDPDSATARPIGRRAGPLALRVWWDDGSGFDLTEAGTRKRLAIHVVREPEDVEAIATLGFDPVAELTSARLGAALHSRNQQLKGALRDQRLVAGVGNAYSDEILHAARMSPFALTDALTEDDVDRLARATGEVLAAAIDAAEGKPAAELKDAKRRGMAVHGRTGLPCPVCGDVVREVSFADRSLQYCATCQTGGKPLADRRMSRLLK